MPVTPALVEELIHGVRVQDPYRWLEDRSPETEEWIRERQKQCAAYFAEFEDMDAIRRRVRENLDIPVVDQPTRVGHLHFYRRRDRGQQQASIYVREESSGQEGLIVDPSSKGPFASVSIYRIARDGSLLAYVESDGGSDRGSVQVVSAASGVPVGDPLKSGYTRGLVFTPSQSGYFYCHEDGSWPAEHAIVRRFFDGRPDEVAFRVTASPGSRLRVIGDELMIGAVSVYESEDRAYVEDLWIAEMGDSLEWRLVFKNRRLPFRLFLKERRLFAVSYDNAPNGKLIELDQNGEEERTIVPHSEVLMSQIAFVENSVFVCSAGAERSSIRRWSLEGEELAAPDVPVGTTATLLPSYGPSSSLFFTCESFDRPQSIYEYELATQQVKPRPDATVCPDKDHVKIRRTSYPSLDGTDIAITLISRKASAEQTCMPVIMTSYGAFGVPSTPQFSVLVSMLLDRGFLFALPHIRGGGEFGAEWHRAGRGENKLTSFDDFIAAAVWLHSKGIADPKRIAIFGGSSSGLLVAVAMTQRPELFGAVLCIAPLLDMVRYEVFDRASKWNSEYGSCRSKEQFQILRSYSPYHQFRPDRWYPSVLFVSGDQDDRCNPAHVRKMAAAMHNNAMRSRPVLLDYSEQRGHSPNLPLDVRVEALARRIAFLLRELELPFRYRDRHDCAGS